MDLTNLAAKAVIVLTSGLEEAQQFEQSLLGKQRANVFYWISLTEPRHVDQLARRYLGLSALLSQSHNDATKTRLNAKFEAIRNELKASFGRLYGREGLREKTTKVIQQGEATPIEVSSWHGFAARVQQIVDATYVNEVAVRAPQRNYNVLGGDGSPDAKTNLDIVDAILRFKAGAADDLLGEVETTERAAIIDGVLGANTMFIRRASGWDFKTLDELSGNVKDVIEEIRKHLFRRRERNYSLRELRRVFEAVPYGIPACALPLLIAYAVRDDLGRLTWAQGGSAAKNICDGMVNERIGVRFADFTGHQLNVLEVVRHALDEVNEDKFAWLAAEQEAARQAVEQLRDWVKTIPEPILKSPKLDKRFREIADAFKGVAVSTNEIVDRLVAAVDPKRELGAGTASYEAKKKTRETLVEILTAYRQVEDERRFDFFRQVRAAVETLGEDLERDAILAEIASMNSEGVHVAELLRNFPLSDRACTALIERLSGTRFDEVSDTSAGMAIGRLATMIDTARRLIARAASLQATLRTSSSTTSVEGANQEDEQNEDDSPSATPVTPTTSFWPQVQPTQPRATSTGISTTMPAPYWPGVARHEESTQTTQSTGDAADWRIALKDVLSNWSEREDIDKDEIIALLQAFIAELEVKV
jgi:2-hydroxychromene-2-carboxylate isomerase